MKKTGRTGKAPGIIAVVLIAVFYADAYADKKTVRIAAAASLIPVIMEIERLYEREIRNVDIEVIPGASGNLASQIINGAPYDIFISADIEYPGKLKSMGLTLAGPEIYAEGILVLFTVKKIDLTKGIYAVNDVGVRRISIANPDTAPYGKAAMEAMKRAGLLQSAEKKIVYAGNIMQAVQQTITGSDLGFVARSLMYDNAVPKYSENVNWINLPESLSPPLKQGVVLLRRSSGNSEAEHFYRYLLTDEMKRVFIKYGYRLIEREMNHACSRFYTIFSQH
jgi:molybdate transport system substrate-binding protein